MNLYMKMGKHSDIAHCIFENILVEEIKNEYEYASKLKKIDITWENSPISESFMVFIETILPSAGETTAELLFGIFLCGFLKK